jgi:hypothetical protein
MHREFSIIAKEGKGVVGPNTQGLLSLGFASRRKEGTTAFLFPIY